MANQNAFLDLIKSKLGNYIQESTIDKGEIVFRVQREKILDFFNLLKLDSELQFNLFVNVTAVDWLDSSVERFEVVYHLMSTTKNCRIRIKTWVPEGDCKVPSVTSLWAGANFMEREVWDMYGIVFVGHPELRRILMYDEFVGHPLRKDYPVQAKQPRIRMLEPEVRNTAVDMNRDPLVKISPKKPNINLSQKVA